MNQEAGRIWANVVVIAKGKACVYFFITLIYLPRVKIVALAGLKINRSRFYGSLNEGLGRVFITT